MFGDKVLYDFLKKLDIIFEYYEHPEAPTVEIASIYWKDLDATHCKNLFFRNHKGNKHFLVILDYRYQLNIKDLEHRLKQGKLTFASEARMHKYLKINPGSVSPLSLIHDTENHVYIFFDKNLLKSKKISFHPNQNTSTLVMNFKDFLRFMEKTGNSYEFLHLYEKKL